MNGIVTVLFLPFFSVVTAQVNTIDSVYSKEVHDGFSITVRTPAQYSASKEYHHVYITDATRGFGEYILGKKSSWSASVPLNCIIIAIGHTGKWPRHQKRNRDFIPSDVSGNAVTNFGHAGRFYLFLKNELVPRIEKTYPLRKERIFIGHSLGGLFGLYTLFRDDTLFDRHFVISPSCWANKYEIGRIEELFSRKNTSLAADVTIYAGKLEFLNKVLTSTRRFCTTLQKRNYSGLKFIKHELSGLNHYSIRKPAVDRIFESLKD